MKGALGLLLLLFASQLAAASTSLPQCRFALRYNVSTIATDADAQRRFIDDVLRAEYEFMRGGVGSNAVSGLTYDGRPIDPVTGNITEEVWNWSASSKEALHLNILALSVDGSIALPTASEALDTLTRKIDSYFDFDRRFPGFGGFLPWFVAKDDGMTPTADFAKRTPSLDNGQLIWSMTAVSVALRRHGHNALAARYDAYVAKLAKNVLTVFADGNGRIRTVANIIDIHSEPKRENYYTDSPCGNPCYLDDPYEGELLGFFADFFADWKAVNDDREAMWKLKREKLVSIDYKTETGPITVAKGWWFSAHEQWKALYLPYDKVEVADRVLRNCERARTWHAASHSKPGLYASVTEPCVREYGPCPFNYISATGINEIAFEPVMRTDVATPYGAFPVVMADRGIGLAWYLTMLQAPSMQTPFGSAESFFLSGKGVCPCLTWDSKITTLVAMLGGVADLNREYMAQKGVLDRFMEVVNREYGAAFASGIRGEHLGYKMPSSAVPALIDDFTLCSAK